MAGEEPRVAGRKQQKLHGRAFYESIGSPKLVLAPMVQQSEFAWRMLTRSFMPPSSSPNALLAYTPMLHSRMFVDTPKYRDAHFQPLKSGAVPSPPDPHRASQFGPSELHLDGNPQLDRPLFVQFCSNSPDDLLLAAQHVQPFCDAVDLNLGCPQGIARRGHYGAFLQEDWDTIHNLISRLHADLEVPVTAKMRVLETPEKTLKYAKMILSAGASIITVHGRRREQKGHNTGLADWSMLRYLRENLPRDTVIFANGNILQHGDIARCLKETGADGVMSAEANLCDPSIFAGPPPIGEEGREYWRATADVGGYRVDAVMRRYLDIVYKHVLQSPIPPRQPLFIPADKEYLGAMEPNVSEALDPDERKKRKEPYANSDDADEGTAVKKMRKKQKKSTDPNLTAMQAHLFNLLRPLVGTHHDVRDALAKCRAGDMTAFEGVLGMVEARVKEGILDYEENSGAVPTLLESYPQPSPTGCESSIAAVQRCKRPWWVCQSYVRPLPKEALEKGSMTLGKKDKERARLEGEKSEVGSSSNKSSETIGAGETEAESVGQNVAHG
ncbi:putative dihydrouridine synthase family protein [Lineolata rhizophorae]|uniref:tRNA-dihydrouridine(16/17) synthase [NAD(P)(+)] n=1 Tax=Lineolata rhizophorae TaxID=578093 RepID=A0A6A6PDE7_9PEZI|nr:putative dihydrouridine synthase family protein [Lineolata rhizophorae]